MHFTGKEKLVAALDAAVRLEDETAVTAALRETLVALFADREVGLPRAVLEPIADHYARRELHVSPDLGYSVIAMTWGPGQGTRIHDHDGAWCVEGVWHGRLAITQYEPRERDGDGARWRFARMGDIEAGPGTAGSLIPPHEYHAIRNPSGEDIAVSLHVYQRQLLRCHVFVPEAANETCDDGWLVREERLLGTDAAR
ncbi:cysteine dioxygenase family protein [Pseudoxanthomonas sp. 10H]|uniref:cysteine dioxygenase family protein n=1 Tax=Pseudoxanthomonas sp. 10H TaxID=3242729 RepID=UPI0035578854